jgi:argininosuccinate lyase
MMKPVWTARTGLTVDANFLAYSQTISDDAPYVQHDLVGSIAHVKGLQQVGLLEAAEADALVAGLKGLWSAWKDGNWTLDASLEDVHMNIESTLTHQLGDTGKKLHTGRSRNDQVATCINLFAREGLAALADSIGHLVAALMAQAETHASTPWVARTHGQLAQPATLGFLLAAHAARFQDVQLQVLQAFTAIGESPLGAGAVAGSTLPIDPVYTANLLGLRPLRSALLASGCRDTVAVTCQVAARAGSVAAGLAHDLLDLFGQKALILPAGLTTGSSLMPQKRNPDALELARGKGNGLQGPLAAVTAITTGLGLGYMRDLQATKPALTQAVTDSVGTIQVLTACVQGAAFDKPVLTASLAAPGITATDVAEALVVSGMSFRDAYLVVAEAFADVETGLTPAEALAGQGLSNDALDAALEALKPNPALRATLGGPAPASVLETLSGLIEEQESLSGMTKRALLAANAPFSLLETLEVSA